MSLETRAFRIQDYDSAVSLWKSTNGIGLSSADDRDRIAQLLMRNPGLSRVVVDDGHVIATLLCGHDGRRGYLYHLVVADNYRRRGLGRRLVNACLDDLRREGILKCHLFVFGGNDAGKSFWRATGWQERLDIALFSKDVPAEPRGGTEPNQKPADAE
jgi:ribosomal protein S18 acetylase RimI-like enzyme